MSDPRVRQSFALRLEAATRDALIPVPPHTTNGDEARYPDKSGTYTKGVLQDGIGLVNPSAFQTFRHAIDTGTFAAFENVILGGTRTLNGPLAGNAFSLEGCDVVQFGNAPIACQSNKPGRGPTRAGPRECCLRHGTGGTLLGFAAPGCRVYRLRFKSYRRAGCGRAGHHAHVRRPEEWSRVTSRRTCCSADPTRAKPLGLTCLSCISSPPTSVRSRSASSSSPTWRTSIT